jgi:hypothetical protein
MKGDFHENVHQIHKWLKECRIKHVCHRDRDPAFLPTRLIDIGNSGTLAPDPSLVVKEDVPAGSPYLTLSHSWGQLQPTQLTKASFESMLTKVVFEELNKTFQEAVILVKALGFRYIWIDSLCIIQDSDDDWQKESGQMDLVYTNALFNIAATAAMDGSSGLFAHRDYVSTQSVMAMIPAKGNEPQLLMHHSVDGLLEKSPLNARGWVLQERLLSRANLHFTNIQVFWECGERLACEAVPNYNMEQGSGIREVKRAISRTLSDEVVADMKRTPEQTKNGLALWMRIRSSYSACTLTRSTDNLLPLGV